MRRRLLTLLLVAAAAAVPAAIAADELIPNDPGYSLDPQILKSVDAPAAWAAFPCRGVRIAFLDSGIAPLPDFGTSISAADGWNFVAGNANTVDDNGHGTAVASVVLGQLNDGRGTAGLCPGATAIPVKVTDASSRFHDQTIVIRGLEWAVAHGARVVNMSLQEDPGFTPYQPFVDAVNAAVARGVVVVLIAGNYGRSDAAANAMASGTPNAIRVGGLQPSGDLDPHSNFGAWVDIAAPYSVETDSRDGSVGRTFGTSFAGPMVAAAAAYLLTWNPSLTPAQVKQLLMQSCTPIASLRGKVNCGGRLDVYNALLAAGYTPGAQPPPPVLPPHTLTLGVHGRGTIAGCGAACVKSIADGTSLVLTARPRAGWRFVRWSGWCRATKKPSCRIVVTTDGAAAATFVKKKRQRPR